MIFGEILQVIKVANLHQDLVWWWCCGGQGGHCIKLRGNLIPRGQILKFLCSGEGNIGEHNYLVE